MLQKILRNIVLAGIFVLPFIVLIVSAQLFFPFITGKNFVFRIITEIIFGSWIILAFLNKEYRPKFSWLAGTGFIFLVVMFLADAFGENPLKSFFSNFERMEGFVTLIHLYAYFLILGTMLNVEKLWERLFQTSIGVSVIVGFYGLLQLGGVLEIHQGGARLDATFGNSTYLAVYMLFHIFITTILCLRVKDKTWLKWVYGIIIFLQTFVLYHTATRGAILGLVGGAIVSAVLILIFEKENQMAKKFSIWLVGIIVVLVAVFFAAKNTAIISENPVLGRLASISLTETTTKSRFMVWQMAFKGFEERPILGWGQENFNFVFNKFYNPQMYDQEQWFDRTHNVVLDWLISGGILGFLSYISIFVFLIYYIWKKREDEEGEFLVVEKSLLTGMIAGYFIHNLFVFDNLTSYLLFFTILAYVHQRNAKAIPSIENFEIKEDVTRYVVIPIIVLLFGFSFYFFNFKGIMAGADLIQTVQNQPNGLADNLAYFEKAYSWNSFADPEIDEQMVQVTVSVYTSTNSEITQDLKDKFVTLAKEKMNEQLKRAPNDARYQLFYAMLLSGIGDYKGSLPYMEKAVELSLNKQQMLFELGAIEQRLGQFDQAVLVYKKAYDLAPEYTEAETSYIASLIWNNQTALARKLLETATSSSLISDKNIINAYIGSKHFAEAISLFKEELSRNSSDGQMYIALASTYYAEGDKADAILMLQTAEQIFPSSKTEIDQYISNIKNGTLN